MSSEEELDSTSPEQTSGSQAPASPTKNIYQQLEEIEALVDKGVKPWDIDRYLKEGPDAAGTGIKSSQEFDATQQAIGAFQGGETDSAALAEAAQATTELTPQQQKLDSEIAVIIKSSKEKTQAQVVEDVAAFILGGIGQEDFDLQMQPRVDAVMKAGLTDQLILAVEVLPEDITDGTLTGRTGILFDAQAKAIGYGANNIAVEITEAMERQVLMASEGYKDQARADTSYAYSELSKSALDSGDIVKFDEYHTKAKSISKEIKDPIKRIDSKDSIIYVLKDSMPKDLLKKELLEIDADASTQPASKELTGVYDSLASEFAKLGIEERSKYYTEKVKESDPETYSVNVLNTAAELANQGKLDESITQLSESAKAGLPLEVITGGPVQIESILSKLKDSNRPELIDKFVEAIKLDKTPEGAVLLIKTLTDLGRFQEAKFEFDQKRDLLKALIEPVVDMNDLRNKDEKILSELQSQAVSRGTLKDIQAMGIDEVSIEYQSDGGERLLKDAIRRRTKALIEELQLDPSLAAANSELIKFLLINNPTRTKEDAEFLVSNLSALIDLGNVDMAREVFELQLDAISTAKGHTQVFEGLFLFAHERLKDDQTSTKVFDIWISKIVESNGFEGNEAFILRVPIEAFARTLGLSTEQQIMLDEVSPGILKSIQEGRFSTETIMGLISNISSEQYALLKDFCLRRNKNITDEIQQVLERVESPGQLVESLNIMKLSLALESSQSRFNDSTIDAMIGNDPVLKQRLEATKDYISKLRGVDLAEFLRDLDSVAKIEAANEVLNSQGRSFADFLTEIDFYTQMDIKGSLLISPNTEEAVLAAEKYLASLSEGTDLEFEAIFISEILRAENPAELIEEYTVLKQIIEASDCDWGTKLNPDGTLVEDIGADMMRRIIIGLSRSLDRKLYVEKIGSILNRENVELINTLLFEIDFGLNDDGRADTRRIFNYEIIDNDEINNNPIELITRLAANIKKAQQQRPELDAALKGLDPLTKNRLTRMLLGSLLADNTSNEIIPSIEVIAAIASVSGEDSEIINLIAGREEVLNSFSEDLLNNSDPQKALKLLDEYFKQKKANGEAIGDGVELIDFVLKSEDPENAVVRLGRIDEICKNESWGILSAYLSSSSIVRACLASEEPDKYLESLDLAISRGKIEEVVGVIEQLKSAEEIKEDNIRKLSNDFLEDIVNSTDPSAYCQAWTEILTGDDQLGELIRTDLAEGDYSLCEVVREYIASPNLDIENAKDRIKALEDLDLKDIDLTKLLINSNDQQYHEFSNYLKDLSTRKPESLELLFGVESKYKGHLSTKLFNYLASHIEEPGLIEKLELLIDDEILEKIESANDTQLLETILNNADRVNNFENYISSSIGFHTEKRFTDLFTGPNAPLGIIRKSIQDQLATSENPDALLDTVEKAFTTDIDYWQQLYMLSSLQFSRDLGSKDYEARAGEITYPVSTIPTIAPEAIGQSGLLPIEAIDVEKPLLISEMTIEQKRAIANIDNLADEVVAGLTTIPMKDFRPEYQLAVYAMYLHEVIATSRNEQAKKFADSANRQLVQEQVAGENVLPPGTMVHGSSLIYLSSTLLNGNLCGEALGGSARTDMTPFQVDLSLLPEQETEKTFKEVLDSTLATNYGDIFYIIRRDATNYEHGVEHQGPRGETNVLLPVGVPSTEINGIVIKTTDSEAPSTVRLAILNSGFYIPVYNHEGELIFTPEEYDAAVEDLNLAAVSVDVWDMNWRTGEQAGSNEGGFYDVPDGRGGTRKYYVKFDTGEPDKITHIWSEILSDRLYKEFGLPTAETEVVQIEGRFAHASEIVENHTPGDASKIAPGFVMDCWLSNWDVPYNPANYITGPDGLAYRIDTGGSLLFRARGGRKDMDSFTEVVTELGAGSNDEDLGSGMRQKYPGLTDEMIREQAKHLVEVFTDEKIDELVDSVRMPKIDRDLLKSRLKARRDYIASQVLSEMAMAS
jgi:hypothetical protein